MEPPARPIEKDVKLSHNAIPIEQRLKALQERRDYFRYFSKLSIGFQAITESSFSDNGSLSSPNSTSNGYHSNHAETLDDLFQDFWKIFINNRGEPFTYNGYVVETKDMEVAILEYFAKLWRLKESESGDDKSRGYWGYVTSLGASEANILALYNARDYLTGLKPLLHKQQETPEVQKLCVAETSHDNSIIENGNETISGNAVVTPVVFYSQEAYFGFKKTLSILQMKSFNELGSGLFPCPLKFPEDYPSTFIEELLDDNGWPYTVPCNEDDSMHIPSLVKLVAAFVSKGYPPVVIFTCGSTSTGAYDHPQEAIKQLVPILKQHNMYQRRVYCSKNSTNFEIRNGFWFHVDAALGAASLPFLEMAIQQGLVDNMFPDGFPVFDFRIPEIASISMSIYKWLVGLPFPAAVYMVRQEYELKPLSIPVFGQKLDNTLCGSRAGHGVLLTWDFLAKTSYEEMIAEVVKAENSILFLIRKLQELERVHGQNLWIFRSPGSLFVSFKRPREDILFKYSLPCFLRLIRGKKEGKNILERRNCARISVMPHVELQYLEMVLEDLKKPGAFPISHDCDGFRY